MTSMEAKFQIYAGILVRNALSNYIRELCFVNDVGCNIIENKEFLGSTFLVTLTGEEETVGWAIAKIKSKGETHV